MDACKKTFSAITLATSFALTSCGGGGGSNSSNNEQTSSTQHSIYYTTEISADQVPFFYSINSQNTARLGDGFLEAAGFDQDSIKIVHQGKFYFNGKDSTTGFELWVYDPTEPEAAGSNPKMLKDIAAGTDNSFPYAFQIIGNKLYFSADDKIKGREPWVYDPALPVSNTNPKLLADINSAAGSVPSTFVELGGKAYFSARTPSEGRELWQFDPSLPISINNPSLVKDILPGSVSSNPVSLTVHNNKLYMAASSGFWQYDPAEAVSPTNPSEISSSISPIELTIVGEYLFFNANTNTNGKELFRYDPRQAASSTNPLLIDIAPGSTNSFPAYLTAFNDKLFFTANDGVNGNELWKLDSTQPISVGTNPKMLDDTTPGNVSTQIDSMTNYNGKLYFSTPDSLNSSGYALAEFDPTLDVSSWGANNPKFLTTHPQPLYELFGFSYQ